MLAAAIFLLAAADRCHAQKPTTVINKVVIDAGHGGKDPGTVSRQYGYREKDINLAVALRLGRLINEHYPDVTVIYTRKTDVLIPLAERANIANKAAANLFISIHVNASDKSTSASGTETLVMGMDKAGANLDIAMRENNVVTFEENYQTKYQEFTPGSTESLIMFSMMQYAYQEQSFVLADMVQKQFIRNTDMSNRGVKQAPILVLWRTAMPSILTEFGFMSNPNNAKYLGSEEGKDMYARCVFNAFSEYKTRADGSGKIIILDTPAQAPATSSDPVVTAAPTNDKQAAGRVVYRIQVLTSAKKMPKNSSNFGPYRGEVTEIKNGNIYKYYTKEASSHKDALSLQREVRKHIKDAFVVAFIDGKPAKVEDAKKINNER